GKIMSEAAHSIIGMFSAKPLGMEHNTSNSDFASLLRSPEEQPHAGDAVMDISPSDLKNVDAGENDMALDHNADASAAVSIANQSFSKPLFDQHVSAEQIVQDAASAESSEDVPSDIKFSLISNRDVMISGNPLPRNSGATLESGTENNVLAAKPGLPSEIPAPSANSNLVESSRLKAAPTASLADNVAGHATSSRSHTELPQAHNDTRINAVRTEVAPAAGRSNIVEGDLTKGRMEPDDVRGNSLKSGANGTPTVRLSNSVDGRPAMDRLNNILAQPGTVTLENISDLDAASTVRLTDIVEDLATTHRLNNDQPQASKASLVDGPQIDSGPAFRAATAIDGDQPIKEASTTAPGARMRPVGIQNNLDFPINDNLQPKQGDELVEKTQSSVLQPQKNEQPVSSSPVRENAIGTTMFPSSDAVLLKLQNLHRQRLHSADEQEATTVDTSKVSSVENPHAKFQGLSNRLDLGRKEGSSTKSKLKPDALNDAVSLKSVGKTDEYLRPSIEAFKMDGVLPVKAPEQSAEPQPILTAMANGTVRETPQRSVPFDMSAPQVAARLATEITGLVAAGGTKKFELNPRNLGRMEITFVTQGSSEIVEIQTEHRGAKEVLVQHSQMLQDILKSQGREDLSLRIEVKENSFSTSKGEGDDMSQQENRDAQEHPRQPSQSPRMAASFESVPENHLASDNSRYA
ncbi:MAG: flagellar hook-length control protein FliK, partial [Parasphingorhabdus sp.]